MKIYVNEKERAMLAIAITDAMAKVQERAKRDGWRESEIAMMLADWAELGTKLGKKAPRGKAVRK